MDESLIAAYIRKHPGATRESAALNLMYFKITDLAGLEAHEAKALNFSENGWNYEMDFSDSPDTPNDAGQQLEKLVQEKMQGTELSYSEAFNFVQTENPELVVEYMDAIGL